MCCYCLEKQSSRAWCFFCVWECHESPWDAWALTGKVFDTCQKFVIDQSPAIGNKWRWDWFFTDVESAGGKAFRWGEHSATLSEMAFQGSQKKRSCWNIIIDVQKISLPPCSSAGLNHLVALDQALESFLWETISTVAGELGRFKLLLTDFHTDWVWKRKLRCNHKKSAVFYVTVEKKKKRALQTTLSKNPSALNSPHWCMVIKLTWLTSLVLLYICTILLICVF